MSERGELPSFGEGARALLTTRSLTCQPYAKRARPASPLEEEYRSALRAAAGALEVLEVLLPKAPAPDWLLGSVELLHQRLGGLRRGLLSGARLDGVAVDSGGSITHQHVL